MNATDSKTTLPVFTALERAALYARVSGDDSKQEGRNIKSQLEMNREYAKEKGYQVIAELAEDEKKFTSGAEIDLPQLNKALEMARNSEFQVLIVRELDRFARSLTKQLSIEAQFKRYGVRVEYVLYQFPDTPEGRLNKHIGATIAEYQREDTIRKLVRGRRNKVKDGNVLVAGRPPYGYKLDEIDGKTTLVIVAEEARIVKLIFQWYLEGLSLGQIAERLTNMRVKTPNETNRRAISKKKMGFAEWGRATISYILNNETYAGIWRFGKTGDGDAIEVPVSPVVTREMFDAVQTKRKQNKQLSKRKSKHEFLLAKRIHCGHCGYKIVSNGTRSASGKVYKYYHCPSRIGKEYVRDCDLPTFKADEVDTVVWNWLESFLKDPIARDKGIEEYQGDRKKDTEPLREQISITEDLIEQYNQELTGLLKDLKATHQRNSPRTRAAILNDLERLEGTLDRLENRKAALTRLLEAQTLTEQQVKDIKEYFNEIAQDLDTLREDFEGRRRLVELLDVWATLAVEDGQKVVYVQCRLGKKRFELCPMPDALDIIQKDFERCQTPNIM